MWAGCVHALVCACGVFACACTLQRAAAATCLGPGPPSRLTPPPVPPPLPHPSLTPPSPLPPSLPLPLPLHHPPTQQARTASATPASLPSLIWWSQPTPPSAQTSRGGWEGAAAAAPRSRSSRRRGGGGGKGGKGKRGGCGGEEVAADGGQEEEEEAAQVQAPPTRAVSRGRGGKGGAMGGVGGAREGVGGVLKVRAGRARPPNRAHPPHNTRTHPRSQDFPPLGAIHWHRLVLDESHTVKQHTAGHTKACVALKADRRWACTGEGVWVGGGGGGGASVHVYPPTPTRPPTYLPTPQAPPSPPTWATCTASSLPWAWSPSTSG